VRYNIDIESTIRVGFLDSGIGGLILAMDVASNINDSLRSITKRSKHNIQFLHIGDTENTPYGNKSPSHVKQLASALVSRANSYKCDIIAIACNTILSVVPNDEIISTSKLGQKFVILSMIERSTIELYRIAKSNPASIESDEIHIAILATENTILSQKYQSALHQIHEQSGSQKKLIIHSHFPNSWVPIIESSKTIDPTIIDIIRSDLQKLIKNDRKMLISAVGLFCTHYPFFKDPISSILTNFGYSNIPLVSQSHSVSRDILKAILLRSCDKSKNYSDEPSFKIASVVDGCSERVRNFINSINNIEIEKVNYITGNSNQSFDSYEITVAA